jgi:DNA invertase Pin-like site-specific DNA recombinase
MSNLRKALIYARCSTRKDQRPEVQVEELKRFAEARGWIVNPDHVIIDEGISGRNPNRPGLNKVLSLARSRKIDCILILKLDRLFRSLKHIVVTLEELSELGVQLVSVKESLDMTTSAGRLMIHLISSFAEFEAELARERTLIGLEFSRNKGVKLGRPSTVNYEEITRLREQGMSYRQIQKLGYSSWAIQKTTELMQRKSPQNSDDFETVSNPLETRVYKSSDQT